MLEKRGFTPLVSARFGKVSFPLIGLLPFMACFVASSVKRPTGSRNPVHASLLLRIYFTGDAH